MVATFGQGLWCVVTDGQASHSIVERATALTGLSNNVTYSLLEDREGNIWVGTTEGLNRLTPHKVTQMVDLGLVTGLATVPNGDVWAATPDWTVSAQAVGDRMGTGPELLPRLRRPRDVRRQERHDLDCDRRRRLEISERHDAPVPVTMSLRHAVAMTPDEHGSLWINDLDRGCESQRRQGRALQSSGRTQGDAHRPDVHRPTRARLAGTCDWSGRRGLAPTTRSASTVLRMD